MRVRKVAYDSSMILVYVNSAVSEHTARSTAPFWRQQTRLCDQSIHEGYNVDFTSGRSPKLARLAVQAVL